MIGADGGGNGGVIVMASPEWYEVSYTINPWMRPDEWGRDRDGARQRAQAQWDALADRLRRAGMTVEVVPAAPGLPDLVFPANSAVVLDRRALLARFRRPERRGEEACFLRFFEDLRRRGLIDHVQRMPDGIFQEGAGDCLWDSSRGLFWGAHGPRSAPESLDHIAGFFDAPVVGLELITDRFYHLDTCFSVLSGGEIVYFPPALSRESREAVAERVPPEQRIVATEDEAHAFSLNAICLGHDLIMTPPPPRLRAMLEERGYRCIGIDLSSFVLSGGASFCMTLRLDHTGGRLTADAGGPSAERIGS
ncbi:MAG: arginine deiminase-related protein [Magnetospirillum sp.]|nr:arginine deiminase-related protein [Magnetospirillum sp.]